MAHSRAAPAVSVRCTGGMAWRAVQCLLPALAAGVMVVWAAGLPGGRAVPFALTGAVLSGLLLAVVVWRRLHSAPVLLAWDGQLWTADGTSGALDVMIDLGPWLLLRLRPTPAGAARWVAVTAAEASSAWHALRAAAYAPAARPQVHPQTPRHPETGRPSPSAAD